MVFFGLPERIRTAGLQSRSLTRYPAVPRVDVILPKYYTTSYAKMQDPFGEKFGFYTSDFDDV